LTSLHVFELETYLWLNTAFCNVKPCGL